MKQIQKHTEQKITREMTIGELVQDYPSVVEILLDEGVHCIGCGAAFWETIEQGLMGHGKTNEEIDEVIKKLNAAIPQELGNPEKLIVTDKAVNKLKEILKKNKKEGKMLRIEVTTGGCSGFKYGFRLVEKESKDDIVVEEQGVNILLDPESFSMLKGAKVDYVESLSGAGFKISNPNAERTCGCGQSFR